MIGLDRWVQFITARLDEDEQAARAALRADVCCWEHERLGGHDRLIEMYTYADGTEDSDVIAFFGADGLAEHTARHDPSRALRKSRRGAAHWPGTPASTSARSRRTNGTGTRAGSGSTT